jgi:hypothetical protein
MGGGADAATISCHKSTPPRVVLIRTNLSGCAMLKYYDGSGGGELNQEGERVWADDDPLVCRLRAMKWAEVPTDVRERCWGAIKHQIDDLERQGVLPGAGPNLDVNCDRYGFSRRRELCHETASHIDAITPSRSYGPRGLAFAAR